MSLTINSKRMFGVVISTLILILAISAYYYVQLKGIDPGDAYEG